MWLAVMVNWRPLLDPTVPVEVAPSPQSIVAPSVATEALGLASVKAASRTAVAEPGATVRFAIPAPVKGTSSRGQDSCRLLLTLAGLPDTRKLSIRLTLPRFLETSLTTSSGAATEMISPDLAG